MVREQRLSAPFSFVTQALTHPFQHLRAWQSLVVLQLP